ncbi:efflux transporter outer membrane subunit [Nevskia soli]|uniref:efflux transporter outer membrane subunit n=1 Tax=Nevskia soli TaxID=418856 RepID=UPI0004A71997|nr:efflux transporter outer membrane subunit [Nevskia soli]
MIRTSRLALALGAALLTSCVLPPKDAPREQAIGDTALGLSTAAMPAVGDSWWHAYQDPQLDRLVEATLANNPTLAQAMARVREAQAMADTAHAGLLPSVSYDAKDTRQRFSNNDIIPPPYNGGIYWEGQQGINLSWDLDFWGKQAALIRQARSQTAAANLDIASARLALAGAVAQAYVELYRNFALAEVARRTEEQRLHILDITRSRVKAGLDTNVELREAEGAVPQAHVELTQAQAAVALSIHQLAALSGRGADAYAEIKQPHLNLDAALPLPQALPADLLGRRPDVLAARLRVEAATDGRAAAKAAFYPDVSLTAFAGTSAIGFKTLFEAASGAYGVGPAIHLPLFDAGRLKANFRGATAEIDDAVAGYNETVLQAVRQASDQLSTIDALNYELGEQQKSLNAAEEAYRLAGERYKAGLSGYLSVLNAETQVLSARRQRVDLVSAHAVSRVTLLLALGGSFDAEAPATAQTASTTQ